MSEDLGNINIDDYMTGAGYGNSSNLPMEPGSMATAGMFDGEADPRVQLQGILEYQKGQYGVTVPTTEAASGLPAAQGLHRGGGAFAQNNARNAMTNVMRPAPKVDDHPITIAMPTHSGINAQRRKVHTPQNTYQGTVLDGIGASVLSRDERLSKQEQFKAMAKKDQEIRDARRQQLIQENADGHYTKEKLVQINRKYREDAEEPGDSYDSYVDTMGGDAYDSTTLTEARLKAKRDRQEEYKLMLREQQELKKLHDLQKAQPPSSPGRSSRGSPVRGALATIGMSGPTVTDKAGGMTEEQRSRYRHQQRQYREQLDNQIENRKNDQKQQGQPRRRLSKDIDVQQMREQDATQARLVALKEIPKAEISEYERKRLQQQKLLVKSLESTSNNLDYALAGNGSSTQIKPEGTTKTEEDEGDYFSGVGQYQADLQSKDRKKASAEAYQKQLSSDKSKDAIHLPRRSLRDMKRDPLALNEQEEARIRAGYQNGGVGVFTSPNKHPSANLPQVARGKFGSVANGSINMAPGDMDIIHQNKQAAQAKYAAQLTEDSKTQQRTSPRRSIAAEQRARRMEENAVPYWPENLTGPGASLSNGTLSGSMDQDDKRKRQETLRQELMRDEQQRAAAKEAELSMRSPRSPREERLHGVPVQTKQKQPYSLENEHTPDIHEPGSVSPVRASQGLYNQFHQSLDEPSLTVQEEEDREAIAAYEEYLRQAAAVEAQRRIRINRTSNREALASALYDDPLAQK